MKILYILPNDNVYVLYNPSYAYVVTIVFTN